MKENIPKLFQKENFLKREKLHIMSDECLKDGKYAGLCFVINSVRLLTCFSKSQ